MDKYKSNRHRAYNRLGATYGYTGKAVGAKRVGGGGGGVSGYHSTFMLRVNICLSLAVIAAVAIRLNNSTVNRVTERLNTELRTNTTSEEVASVGSVLGSMLGIGEGDGGGTVVLDDAVKERIREQSSAYQRTQESIRAQQGGNP